MTHALIVDDDEPIREALALVLEEAGFGCSQAANGEEALRLVRSAQDGLVVLLDLDDAHA